MDPPSPKRSDGGMPITAIGRWVWAALAALPLVVVAAGIGFDGGTLDAAFARYYLVVLAGLAVLYAVAMRVVESMARKSARRIEALHDSVTGLPSSELFCDRVQQVMLISERDGSVVPVILMGIDLFDEIRSALGRDGTDVLVRALKDRLEELLRESDTLARYSESEFAILLPSAQDAEGARIVVSKLSQGLHEAFEVNGIPIEVQATFGVAVAPEHGRDAATVMRSASAALTWARGNGVRSEIYAVEHDSNNSDRVALVAELRKAIEDNQLVLFYQPKSSFVSGHVTGVEALVRWMHPERGIVPPDLFIPLAEETDLMGPLTDYVLEEAIKQLSEWRLRGIAVTVAVNISARNLSDPDLTSTVAQLLEKWSVEPSWLELEVTETTVMNDQSRAALVLQTLADMGIRLSIDDYGTGYTSLAYLRRLPINGLKIDRLFVQNVNEQEKDEIIVRSTIELGRGLGLHIVAEGVETQEVWDKLEELGCDLAQGYFLSKPVPPAEIVFN